jgi:hypothetical protein
MPQLHQALWIPLLLNEDRTKDFGNVVKEIRERLADANLSHTNA